MKRSEHKNLLPDIGFKIAAVFNKSHARFAISEESVPKLDAKTRRHSRVQCA